MYRLYRHDRAHVRGTTGRPGTRHDLGPADAGLTNTREIFEQQEKYFKGKVVILTVHSLILYQHPVDLLTFFCTLLKKF